MKQHNRVDQWRRNKANEHKLLIVQSTFDGAWTVVDYNCDVMARKFSRGRSGWVEANSYARKIALKRSITRMAMQAIARLDGDAA